MTTKKEQRIEAGHQLLCLAFRYYNTYISVPQLLLNCAEHIYNNKQIYLKTFSRRTCLPLRRLSGEATVDKRLIVSFLRRILHLLGYGFIIKRRSIVVHSKPASAYFYAILKLCKKIQMLCPSKNIVHPSDYKSQRKPTSRRRI